MTLLAGFRVHCFFTGFLKTLCDSVLGPDASDPRGQKRNRNGILFPPLPVPQQGG